MSKKHRWNHQASDGFNSRKSEEQEGMEAEAAEQAAPAPAEQEQPELVEFDSWWASRGHLVPAQHKKEILQADFSARGLKNLASMAQWDKALGAYGVKLAS